VVASELAALAPGGGLAASVVALLAWYTKTGREDRKEYRDALAEAKADFEKRIGEEHGRVLETEMNAQKEVDDLRKRLNAAQAGLDAERARARHAELEREEAKIRNQHLSLRLKLARGEEVDWPDD
jgi:hypothetical protein